MDSPDNSSHEQRLVGEFAEQAYLTYAMSTVLERALPFVEDGQKPVQRRILYAMRELGSRHDTPYKKSARIVGDVIGKFHPHGDAAVYEAAVRMAQDFTLRYPLISGQGNFGTRDGDSPAAMRYTEIRLSLFAEKILLSEIEQNTIDFKENYDGSLQEPKLLPARLPILLLNGVSGIAVGMATEIPAHNLAEVANACIALLRYKINQPQLDKLAASSTLAENNDESSDVCEWHRLIYQNILAPDFPGGGTIISPPDEIERIYGQGRGSIRVRACWQNEALARGQYRLIFNEIPPNTNVARVLSEIDELVNPKIKINKKNLSNEQQSLKTQANALIESFRDDSDQSHPVRIIIEPRSKSVEINDLVNFLLAHTSLEGNVSFNMTVIGRDGRPRQKSLVAIISEWCDFRQEVVLRRVENRFLAVEKRVHILEGRKAVLLNIDEVIRIIRQADDAKLELKLNFALSDEQAEDILEIRLRQLSRMESIKIDHELNQLQIEREELLNLLDSEAARQQLIIDELNLDIAQFADPRRTQLEVASKTTSAKLENIVDEAITIILSQKGFIRQRSGHHVDINNLSWKDGDALFAALETRSLHPLVLVNHQGRSFTLKYSDIPGGKGDGAPLSAMVDNPGQIIAMLSGDTDTPLLFATAAGYGFTCKLNDLISRVRAGKAFVSLTDDKNDSSNKIFVRPLNRQLAIDSEDNYIAVLSSKQRLLIYRTNEIKNLSAGGKGVQLIALEQNDSLIDIQQIKQNISIIGNNRLGNQKEIELTPELWAMYLSKRAKKGKSLPLLLSNTYIVSSNV